MPQLDTTTFLPQLFWLVVSFAVLYLVMARVALPRVAAVLEQRQTRISSDLDRAAAAKEEAEAVMAAYEKALAEARAKAQAETKATADRLAAEAAARTEALAAELAVRVRTAEARIAEARRAALAEVETVAAEVAGSATERLSGAYPDIAAVTAAVAAARSEAAGEAR
jgi:F-type H+-transporting ATPase subunit b